MNEEQLKEIAILAKELGFKPKTLSTGVTFEKFTRVDKGLPLNDMCYYLLLCEIQKWLREVHNIHISPMFIGPDTNKYQYRTDVEGSGNTGEYSKWFTNFEECFVDGLMFGLKLIKK